MLSTIHKANDHGVVNRKRKEHGVWNISKVPQPKVIANYNKLMNGVDRSDQILDTNSVLCKSMKWWKTFFYHLTDMAVVNGFILFKEHQAQFPDNNALKRSSNYSLGDFQEEIVRQLCGFSDYGSPPENTMVKSLSSTQREFQLSISQFSLILRDAVWYVIKRVGEILGFNLIAMPLKVRSISMLHSKKCYG